MLVLTTMFINVSNNLPKTSYIKMMDIWLIFNLFIPFVEIILHTYMDMLRYNYNNRFGKHNNFSCNWRSEEDREINHHGRPVKVGDDDNDKDNEDTNKVNLYPQNIFSICIFAQVIPLTPVDTGIGGSIDLISRNEKTQVTALRNHYEK